jgi:hypothetical protein
MSYVSRFLDLFLSMEKPAAPAKTVQQAHKERRRRREQLTNISWRRDYCNDVLCILNDPAHNKTTE